MCGCCFEDELSTGGAMHDHSLRATNSNRLSINTVPALFTHFNLIWNRNGTRLPYSKCTSCVLVSHKSHPACCSRPWDKHWLCALHLYALDQSPLPSCMRFPVSTPAAAGSGQAAALHSDLDGALWPHLAAAARVREIKDCCAYYADC